ncbi:MAG TPA: ergothioneine biosynthesis glutamate--cysteine ligase EgtA [Streptosporangiaceae bacterium]|nr:ergothioneine biosynthesis glutamate--cysteine ligase EgtA [Streptosporangiaceae bacterium]
MVIELPVDTGVAAHVADPPLSQAAAERLIGTSCFKTGPPGLIGAELEWLVGDAADPSLPVPFDRLREVLTTLEYPGSLPGSGLLTLEPGGQVELSTAPAMNLATCVAAASEDLTVLRDAFGAAGLTLSGHGMDQHRPPNRVLDLPRYAAMEQYFDRRGHWGRLMMCSTASVQVSVDAGHDNHSNSGYHFRWRLLHALGPVLVAAFANSPLRRGRPTGWKCTRQLVWSRLDPCRTHAPPGAEPRRTRTRLDARRAAAARADPRADWVGYAMDADVLCMRRPDGERWAVPAGLSFRDWLRQPGNSGPTAADLTYHLSTLFPPVRARGHLELRMIDAQPGDGWIVPVALVAALADDPVAADAAMAACEPVWHRPGRLAARDDPWLRAARYGLADPVLASAARQCFEAADAALARSRAPRPIRAALGGFADRYVRSNRCPADDILDNLRSVEGL